MWRSCNWIWILFCSLVFQVNSGFGQTISRKTRIEKASTLRALENKGQWNAPADFRVTLNSGYLFLRNDGFVYNFIEDNAGISHKDHQHSSEIETKNQIRKDEPEIVKSHGLKLNFLNSNPDCILVGKEKYVTDYNYFKGRDKAQWVSGVKAYKAVEYSQLYPGIDLLFYEKGGHAKYDLYVAPGHSADAILLQYEGADSVFLANGDLHVITSVNSLVEKHPIAYQYVHGQYKEVKCGFELNEKHEIRFKFPRGYNSSLPLIIDPELIFSTYSGSASDNWGFTATYDRFGNAYSGGIEWNHSNLATGGYPVTVGAIQTTFNGGDKDVAVSKYSPDGSNLLYATYLGGLASESPMSMIVNSNDELVILGNTASGNFPVTNGAFDPSLNDGVVTGFDIFISILSPNGTALITSTMVGGNANDGFNDLEYFYGDNYRSEVIVDSLDNIYVASNTWSSDFPVTSGAFDPTSNGSQEAVVFKMNSDATAMIWGSYLGGSGLDEASGIALDSMNNVFVCGGTTNIGFPVTSLAINQTFEGGLNIKGVTPASLQCDGFVTKISASGDSILASTLLQATNKAFELAYLVETDLDGNVIVYGITEGDYPVTSNTYSNNGAKQFLHKLTPDLSTTLFSSRFGSSNGTLLSPSALMVDSCSRIYISGWGGNVSFLYSSTNPNYITGFPTTSGAFQTVTDGRDFYLAVFGKDMSTLNYATYMGGTLSGEHVDGGTSRFSTDGTIYQAVCAGCGGNSDFPVTPGVYAPQNGNTVNCNAVVFKMEFAQSIVDVDIDNDVNATLFCGDTGVLFENVSYNANEYWWDFGDGTTLHTFSDSSVYHYYDSAGDYRVSLIGYNDGNCFEKPSDTAFFNLKIVSPPVAVAGNDTTVETCQTILLNACCGISYSWSPGKYLSDSTISNPVLISDVSEVFYVEIRDSNNCLTIDSFQVNIIDVAPVIPNIFTPNRDGQNETFQLKGFCRSFHLDLYNRWGRKVYSDPDYKGDFDGGNLPDGEYYYFLTSDIRTYKGWVRISR